MTIEELLERLSGVRKTRNGFLALCPAHEDKSPSLSIRAGERWLLTKCYVGCTTAEICEAIGISVSDLAYESPKPTAPSLRNDAIEVAELFVDLHRPKPKGMERAKMIQHIAGKLRDAPSPSPPPRKPHA